MGAGAAGLTAALRAAEGGARVTLFNAHPSLGLKILMSGGTRCNVTHQVVTERDYHGGSRRVVARILRAFTVPETIEWFGSLGVGLKLEDTGKYFPVTDEARTVLDALVAGCERAGVSIERGARVVRLERGSGAGGGGRGAKGTAGEGGTDSGPAPGTWRLGIQRVRDAAAFSAEVRALDEAHRTLPAVTPGEWLEAESVVLASGGLSFPRTGSDGTGYALAVALGHSLVPPVPALTPLTADDELCDAAQGLTCEAELTLHVERARVANAAGSLLIAHFGYSGPAALDLSRHWMRSEGPRAVSANFMPGETRESLLAFWKRLANEMPQTGTKRFLAHRLPERLAERLCVEAGVDPATMLGQVDRAHRDALIGRVVARPMRVTGTLGYEKAEVTAGGVPLNEVDASTLESRVAPGLFLCGEVLDVEGRLGGFNFQWAWSSGTVAGRSVGVDRPASPRRREDAPAGGPPPAE